MALYKSKKQLKQREMEKTKLDEMHLRRPRYLTWKSAETRYLILKSVRQSNANIYIRSCHRMFTRKADEKQILKNVIFVINNKSQVYNQNRQFSDLVSIKFLATPQF